LISRILAGFLFFLPLSLLAQTADTAPFSAGSPFSKYQVDIWKVENGLPQNTVKNIIQTPDGYLWLTTHEGFVRFNGIDFLTFDKKTTSGILNNSFHNIFSSADSALWIGSNGSGLYRLKNGILTRYSKPEGILFDYIRALTEDREGRIWAGTLGGGLSIWDGSRFSPITTRDGLASDLVYAFWQHPDGRMFTGTSKGLSIVKDGKISPNPWENETSGLFIYCFLEISPGELWIGTDRGVLVLKNEKLSVLNEKDGLTNLSVAHLMKDTGGFIWVSTAGGLFRFSGSRFDRLSTKEGLSHNNVWCTFEDKAKNIWVGTTNGLNRLSQRRFSTLNSTNGLPEDFIRSVFQAKNGDIWIGTDGAGAVKLSDGKRVIYTASSGLSDNRIFSIFEDRDHAIWLGTGNGLSAILPSGRIKTLTAKDGLSGTVVMSIIQDSTGALFFGTAGGGLNRFSGGKIKVISNPEVASSNYLRTLFIDSRNRFWVGTNGNGLHQFRNDSLILNPLQGFDQTAAVFAFHEQKDGTLWVGTNNGLFRIKNGIITRLTWQNGLLDDLILRILEDDYGNFWLTCNRGPYQVKIGDLNDAADGIISRFSIRQYDKSDGMKSLQCNGGSQPAGWKMTNGQIWLPSAEGVMITDPGKMAPEAPVPDVLIESVLAGQTDFGGKTDFTLEPDQDKIEFHFIGFNFQAPNRVTYKYKLIGFDEDWTVTSARRTAFYTNLPPGTYTFQVLASNQDGKWNENGAKVTFTRKPGFFETPWFYILAFLAFSAAVYIYFKRRINKLKETRYRLKVLVEERTKDLESQKNRAESALEEAEIAWHEAERSAAVIEAQKQKIVEMDRAKSQFFSNVSHEFRTPLTLTIGPLEHALTGGYGDIPAELKNQMEMMLRNARRLLRLINQLLDISKMESGKMTLHATESNLVSFLKDLAAAFSAYSERRKISLQMSFGTDALPVCFDKDKIDKVFYNLLSNAFKFTSEGGTISLSLAESHPGQEPQFIEVTVEDTGMGIAAEDLPFIFERFRQTQNVSVSGMSGTGIGLALVKDFVELHGGSIRAESTPGKGTRFTVRLLKGKAHLPPEFIFEESPAVPDLMTSENLKMELADLEQDDLNLKRDPDKQTKAPHRQKKELVLVVDDNKDIRNYVKDILKKEYQIAEAGNGEEGLQFISGHHPDLVISDVMMPVMNGYDFCRALKSNPATSNIPVILLTAKATGDMKVEGLESGANDYMYKPFYARELQARAKNLISMYRQEMEVKWINQQLSRTNEQLRDANELKTEFLNLVAHDLKNPLQAISGYSELLLSAKNENAQIQKRAEQIRLAAERMLHQINELLISATIESGRMELSRKPVLLGGMLNRVAGDLQPAASKKNQEIRIETDLDPSVLVDEGRIAECMENLLGNAVKYSPPGTCVRTGIAREKDRILFYVTDEGPGLSSDDLKKVFGKFQRLSAKPTGGETSTGLGLSIVKQLVELHGGSTGVESKPGHGSRFWFELPSFESSDSQP